MEKIKEYRIAKKGHRGNAVSIPKVWIDDNGLSAGDKIEFYRRSANGKDQLILVAKKGTK